MRQGTGLLRLNTLRIPICLPQYMPAKSLPFVGEPSTGACFWCSGAGSLVACNHCPRCFCYNCYKQRHSYGIINWAKVLRDPDFHCPVCTGKEPASNEGGKHLMYMDACVSRCSHICSVMAALIVRCGQM